MSIRPVLWICIVAFAGCHDSFEFSPYQLFDRTAPRDLNAQNLATLLSTPPKDDTITIAFIGDSQRFYDEVELFVDRANRMPSIDFVLLAGDISDFGLLEEFELIHERLEKLTVPYLAVVGNHDVLARGAALFTRMFGPLNFSFAYGGVKFVMHNTNTMEFPSGSVPDMDWLSLELVPEDGVEHFLMVSHVPPFDITFDDSLELPYTSLLSETPGLLASLHGHIHDHYDGYPYGDGVRYITSYVFKQRAFVLLKIVDGKIIKQEIRY